MNALKGIVLLMGVAIAVLMTLIIYGMYQKSQNPDFTFFDSSGDAEKQATAPTIPEAPLAGAPTVQQAAPTQAFRDINIDLPQGASISGASASGNQMVLLIALSDGATEVWVIDLATGQTLGKVKTLP
ncbi:hypothetical protein ACFL12_05845 [Pseudomonadota bacterium]